MILNLDGLEPTISVNWRTKKPVGEQIYAQLLQMIQEKQIRAGDQLPPVRNLADRLKVNFNTIARVYRQLDSEGFISTQQGRGTYVLEAIRQIEEIQSFSKEDFFTRLENFIQGESRRTELPTDTLWKMVGAKRIEHVSNEGVRKKRKKITRKAGWRPFLIKPVNEAEYHQAKRKTHS